MPGDDEVRCVYAYSAKDGSLHWTHRDAAARNVVINSKRDYAAQRRAKKQEAIQ